MQSMQTFWTGTKMTYMVHLPGAKTDLMRQHNVAAEDIVVLEEQPAGAFERVLLAVFEGCYTDKHNLRWGSPTQGALDKGAECVVGFGDKIMRDNAPEVGPYGAESWSVEFWRLLCEQGHTVEQAVSISRNKGNLKSGLRSCEARGNVFIRLKPPRYGNGN